MFEREVEGSADVSAHGLGGGGCVAFFQGVEDTVVLLAGESEACGVVDAAVCVENARLDVAFLDRAREGGVARA